MMKKQEAMKQEEALQVCNETKSTESKSYGFYFDRQGKPIELMDWACKVEDKKYKVILQEEIGDYFISTIWIGLCFISSERNKPLIFETMIFSDDDDDLNNYQERYETEQQAIDGHNLAVMLVRSKILSGLQNETE